MHTKSITEYGIVNFLIEVQKAFDEGYRIDVESNENCPSTFGTLITAVMVRAKDEVKVDAPQTKNTTVDTQTQEVQAATEVQQETKSGRPRKAS